MIQTTSSALSSRFDEALRLAHDFHREQTRKGTGIPYVSHLLQVAGLVLEAGGDEEQAIAALLHDAIEDANTKAEASLREQSIRSEFGDRVTRIVLACTDGDPEEKGVLSWKERKERYLGHLEEVPEDVLLVSISDKLHNARAILHDYRVEGEALWERFATGKGGTLWYYRRLVETYRKRGFTKYVDDLDDVVSAIELQAVYGSRQHILNWVETDHFVDELSRMVQPLGAEVTKADLWWPTGWRDPDEVKLDRVFATRLDGLFDADALAAWWLAHEKNANVPNWDLVATCHIAGKRGLVLVEAKAHEDELSSDGKTLRPGASANSIANHERIGAAIGDAHAALATQLPGIAISRDRAYQFSNRIAHAWWLARAGIPVVIVYLGFLEEDRMARPFRDAKHWEEYLREHAEAVFPVDGFERWIDVGPERFAVAIRAAAAPKERRPRPATWPKVR